MNAFLLYNIQPNPDSGTKVVKIKKHFHLVLKIRSCDESLPCPSDYTTTVGPVQVNVLITIRSPETYLETISDGQI